MALRIEKNSDSVWSIMSDNTLVAEINGSTINLRGTVKMGADLISPSATELAALDGLTATSTELNTLAGVTAGTVAAGKAVVTTTSKHIDAIAITDGGLALGAGAGTAVTSTAAELNYNDIATLGTGAASKAVVLDSSGNYTMPDGGYFKPSQAVLAAAGTGQSTYAVIADEVVAVTGADATVGVALPAAVAGLKITVINTSAASVLPVSPINAGDDQINALTAGTGVFTMGPGKRAVFLATSATKWYVDDLSAATPTTTELNLIDGSVAGTAVASKALVLGTDKNVDVLAIADSGLFLGAGAGTAMTKTAAQLNTVVVGAAAGYMIARSAAPLALDGSNPTSAAHGLTTCVAAFASLAGSTAPGDSTAVVTVVINGANLDFYGWKHQDGADPTFVASTGTETFNWFAIGT
jgi:hypothetical protein